MGRKTKAQRQRTQQKRRGADATKVVLDEAKTVQQTSAKPNTRTQVNDPTGVRLQRFTDALAKTAEMAKAQRNNTGKAVPSEELAKMFPALNGPDRLTPQQMQARHRLMALTEILQAQPQTFLKMLDSLGIPFQHMRNVPNDPSYDTVVILMKDIKESDLRVAEKGSIQDQLYKKEITHGF